MAATFAVIGPGRLGQALARLWVEGGLRLLGFVGTSQPQALAAVEFAGAGSAFVDLDAVRAATVVLIAVRDGELVDVVRAAAERKVPRPCSLWLHASGRHGLEALAPLCAVGARAGLLHPLCPIPDPAAGVRALPGKLACIDGEPRALRLLETLAIKAGLVPFRDPGFDRALYHAAAALAANGLVALFSAARDALLRSAARPWSRELADAVVATLMQQSLLLCLERGPAAALSGPVRRGDVRVVEDHLTALGARSQEELAVYRALAQRAVVLAGEHAAGDLRLGEALAQITRVLAGGEGLVEIVASSMPRGLEEAQALFLRAAMLGTDWHELRLDRWPADEDVGAVVAKATLPVLVTCRMPRDGGLFRGSLEDRRLLVEKALAAGARGIDLEQWESWSPTPRGSLKRVVRSCHLAEKVAVDLEELRDALLAQGGHIAKIVVPLDDLAECGPILDLLSSTDQAERPTVAFGLGPAGTTTRLLACMLGAPLVYTSVVAGAETAPGQLPLDLVAGIYNVRSLSGSTLLFGVLGESVFASLGPWVHNRAFRWFGLDALYVPLETRDPSRLLQALPRRRLRGLSVTAPYKELIAKRCHQLEPAALRLSAVNTVVFAAHGVIQGWNTDVPGVKEALARAGVSERNAGRPAAVLGAGGAARAAVVALQELGFEVAVLARTPDRISAFCAQQKVALLAFDAHVLSSLRPRVVVHATPVGSLGDRSGAARPVPEWVPEPGTVVLDMVYRPHETKLLTDARAAGAVAVPGLEMFLAQAREQVRVFTDRRPTDDLLRRFLTGVV